MSLEEKEIQPDSFYKWQIANAYKISVRTLTFSWLPRFMKELTDLGYRKEDKILSPQIVALIFRKCGPPLINPPKRKK